MRNGTKVVLGSLAGALGIHAAFVACGAGANARGTSTDGGVLDALADVLGSVFDGATKEASAATDGGTCGCGQGPMQTTTAETDPNQLVRGANTGTAQQTPVKVADGPFVLTDASGTVGFSLAVFPSAPACPSGDQVTKCADGALPPYGASYDCASGTIVPITNTFNGNSYGLSHAHYVVQAGQMLCLGQGFGGTATVSWAGFKPYP